MTPHIILRLLYRLASPLAFQNILETQNREPQMFSTDTSAKRLFGTLPFALRKPSVPNNQITRVVLNSNDYPPPSLWATHPSTLRVIWRLIKVTKGLPPSH